MFGTAPTVRVWLLLEYREGWAPKVLDDGRVPEALATTLAEHLSRLPEARLQFIKQPARTAEGRLLYLAVADERAPTLYRVPLRGYDDLRDLDLAALANGGPAWDRYRCLDPLWLVCAHGTHDQCCAKLGLPIYRALGGLVGDSVWQCSHVGGHRFATNVLCMPHGLYYGRVEQRDVAPILDATRDERIRLPNYRGRSCYSAQVQAAEYFLRDARGWTALSDLRLQTEQQVGPDVWQVTFLAPRHDARYRVELATQESEEAAPLSCGAAQSQHVPRHRLLAIQPL